MAYKRKYQAKSVEQKQEEIQTLTKDMEKRVESYYTTPDQLKEYLSFMAKFYKYSTQNISLIENQFQGATAVGSFNFWKEKGFNVQKGEKGIKILVPTRTVERFKDKDGKWKSINKASEEEKKQVKEGKLEKKPGRLYFNIGHVFDISQTNATAKDLPTIFPNRWLDGNVESYKILFKGMEAIAINNGIKIIEPKNELGAAKGVSYTATKEVALNPRNTELQNVKTLLHELAHAKLHTTETHMNYTTSAKEFQAEMTAYAVSSYFGIDTSEYSLGYLASWTQGKELKDKAQLLKEVHETSVEFIETIEKTFERENNQSKDIGVEVMPKNENEKNIYLLRYGGLNHTEEEIISVADLRERSSRDTSFNEITNNEKLTDKEFISEFNKVNEERYIAIDQDEVNRPMMIVQWSESGFEKNQLIPFGEANEQMKERIREIELAKEEANSKGEYVPYEKARYHVVIPKEVDQDFGRMEIITPDRLDLGDGMYISPYHQILEEKPNLTDEVKQSLREEINNHNNNREQFNSIDNEKVMHNDITPKDMHNDITPKEKIYDHHEVLTKIQNETAKEIEEKIGINLNSHWERYEIQLSEDGRVIEEINTNVIFRVGEMQAIVNKFGTDTEKESLDTITKKLDFFLEDDGYDHDELRKGEVLKTPIAKVTSNQLESMKVKCTNGRIEDYHRNFDFDNALRETLNHINHSISESHKDIMNGDIEYKGLYPVDESEVIYCEETGKPLEQDEEVYHKEGYGYIVPEKVNQQDIENGSVYFTTIGYQDVEEKSLAPIQLEKIDEKLNLEDKFNNQHTPLVTLEVLQNANSEEVGRIHMMDSETKEISQLSIWNEDKRNRDDLLINPINKDGKFENVYLNDFLKRDLYEKVQKSIFENTGNQSFVVHQDNAKLNLDKLTTDQRYSKIVEKSMFDTEPKFTPQEIEAYRDLKKEGYAPLKVLDEKIDKVEKDLHTRYSNYQYAKLNEEPGNAQSILKRCSAEDKYYETKLVAVNGGYVKQEDVVKIESKVNESIKGIGSSPEVSKTYTAPQRTQINQTDLPNKSYVGGRNLSDKQQVDSPPVIDKNAKPVSKNKRKQEAEMER
ncbi:hypothetical protein BC30048_p2081 (plasmid) [Bacillus cereus]|nr:hypothetical protein BC30048_p2081 [Bacillus cereus]